MNNRLISICTLVLLCFSTLTLAFNVGIRGTTCSLDSANYNDPCSTLYDGMCDGKHCKCPSNTHEDKSLKRCVSGAPKKSASSDFDDLPFDYVPGAKPDKKPVAPTGGQSPPSSGGQNPSSGGQKPPSSGGSQYPPPQQPAPAGGVITDKHGTNKYGGSYPKQTNNYPGGYPPPNSGYPQPPNPGYQPPNPGYPQPNPGYPPPNPHYPPPNPGYPPPNPGYPPPNQPGRGYPTQPGLYPKQPGGFQPTPPVYPTRPGVKHGHGKGDPHIGEKTGGGIGGGIGLLLIGCLIYFCCCNKAKGKDLLSKLPFMKSNPGNTYQMDSQVQQHPPQQPQPAGMAAYPTQQYPQPCQPFYPTQFPPGQIPQLGQLQPQYPQMGQPQPQYPQMGQPQPQYPQVGQPPQYPPGQPQYPPTGQSPQPLYPSPAVEQGGQATAPPPQ